MIALVGDHVATFSAPQPARYYTRRPNGGDLWRFRDTADRPREQRPSRSLLDGALRPAVATYFPKGNSVSLFIASSRISARAFLMA